MSIPHSVAWRALLSLVLLACGCASVPTGPIVGWEHPYISTYYVEPVVEDDEDCVIRYYVTDYDHSLVRKGDASKRFDVTLKLTTDRVDFRVEKQRRVESGDGAFNLGKLACGDYFVGIAAKDRDNGLDSHTVWQRFRVVKKGAREIPAEKIRVMTAADLAAYGLRNDGTYERFCKIELDEDPAKHIRNYYTKVKEHTEYYLKIVDDYLAAHPHIDDTNRPGYCVYVPAWKGNPVDRAYERQRLVYDRGYDKERVAAEALANSDGLQRFIDEASSNGFRKVVLYPGTYRVSNEHALAIPSNMTLDLGGATLKLNGFAGQHGMMVRMAAVENAALQNGTLEGDYYEHHYGAPGTGKSEWVCGYTIKSYSRDCMVSNVVVKNITGYGGCNGMGKEDPLHPEAKPCLNNGPWIGLKGKIGKLIDISGYQTNGFISVSKALGYQGIRTRGWNYHAYFFDAETNAIAREVGFQYRDMLLDPRAKYVRLEINVANDEERRTNGMSIVRWKAPFNCRVVDCRFERCRAVGMAPAQMKNFLIRGNYFTESGETLATCAFDAEDGWDGMQDVLIENNVFENNHRSDFVACAGHNFMLIGNRARIRLRSRCFSPYAVSNVSNRALFDSGPRTRLGYARFLDNDFYGEVFTSVPAPTLKKFPGAGDWADPILIKLKDKDNVK